MSAFSSSPLWFCKNIADKALSLFFSCVFVTCLLVSAPLAYGQIPDLINYQGRLLDGNGVPTTIANAAFTVGLWQDETSTLPQDKLYEENHTVNVNDGNYSFLIGNGTPVSGTFNANIFNSGTVWIEITVQSETLTPRIALQSTPFAFQTYNTQTLDNKSASYFASSQDITTLLNSFINFCNAQSGAWIENHHRCAIGAVNVSGLDLSNEDFSDITLDGADFTNTDLSNTTFLDASVINTDFTGAIWLNTVCPDGTNSDINGNTCLNNLTIEIPLP